MGSLDKAISAALEAISGDDEVGDDEMRKAVRAALLALREGPTVHKVPATVDGRYADIVTIREDGWATMIDAILAET